MRIIETKDYNDMSKKAANILSAQVIMKPDCVLGLATGSTPIGTYEKLVEWYEKGDLDFSQVTSVNLDEYKGLDRKNDQSYYYFMHEHLFNHVNIKEENTNVPDGTQPDGEKECARYEELIRSLGGVDLQLLGLGHNGHIGFNEPADAFDKTTHCVDLTESTIEANKRFFASADEVPRQAYTMGIGTIMQAKKILIIVSGEDKADIVRDAFFGPVTPRVPASILNQSIYVTLTDHINFAITRYQQGIKPQNALLWEIKRFYSREYELGMYAVKTIEEKLRIRLPEDEAGFIALHFLNAEYGTDIRDAVKFPNLVKKILEIVEEKLQIELDETSLHYERFVTHIKFLLQRVYRKELLPDEESELAELMQKKYQKEYDCSKMVAAYIEEETKCSLSGEEIMYLAIHIRRVTTAEE